MNKVNIGSKVTLRQAESHCRANGECSIEEWLQRSIYIVYFQLYFVMYMYHDYLNSQAAYLQLIALWTLSSPMVILKVDGYSLRTIPTRIPGMSRGGRSRAGWSGDVVAELIAASGRLCAGAGSF